MTTRHKLWESGHDESVEVNQRALIDKVLSRYSGKYTVFRELLQNSDDAQSTVVEIRFRTREFVDGKASGAVVNGDEKSLPDLKIIPVHEWVFKNNGITFRDEDWSRLKKIAEGNPDEQKIGAFGVGFYSLFSVTEEPFVKSGNQWMGFYWKDKKDQLFARRGELDDADQSSWTSFEIVLREASPMPPAFDFTRFLASSITFMTYLEEVSVYFNDWCLVKLNKKIGIPQIKPLPRSLSGRSPSGFMTIAHVKTTPVTIQATLMNWVYTLGTESEKPPKTMKGTATGFFASILNSLTVSSTPQTQAASLSLAISRLDPLEISSTSIILSVFSTDVAVKLDFKLSEEIYRSTKKKPPSNMKYELIYTTKDKYDSSKREDSKLSHSTGSIFQGLRANLDGNVAARVFIGHATAQTTGIGGHMAARFIPTVEREAIDLMDRNVAVWNRELLYIGGVLARAAYEFEMESIRESWDLNAGVFMQVSEKLPEELQSSLTDKAIHVLKFFTFHHSTPSNEVSTLLEAGFFKCGPTDTFPLISTVGIRNTPQIRLPDPSFAFLKQLPLVPAELASEPMVLSLQTKGMIRAIALDDVLNELKSHPLPEEDMASCMKWWISLYNSNGAERLASVRTQLLDAAILLISTSHGDTIIPLHTIKCILNQRNLHGLPSDGPLPPYLLPISITKHFSIDDLKRAFSWLDLTVYDWLSHICEPGVVRTNSTYDLEASPQWSEKVLSFVARNWGHGLTPPMKQQIVDLLKVKKCIPTSDGMKLPNDSYFPNVDIFHDLPVVKFPSGSSIKGQMDRLLQDLNVRKHVDLQIIFNRMIKTNEWTINDLTRYLASVKNNLKEEEIRRLKLTAAFPKERLTAEPDIHTKQRRFRANQLYEPLPVFRQLGLPVIDWEMQTKWRSSSEEAHFLFELGLRRYPPLEELIQLSINPDSTIRANALEYLVSNLHTKYKDDYDVKNYQDIAFIPALRVDESCLGTPRQVFSKPEWLELGFLVIHPSVEPEAVKLLQIREYPTTGQLVEVLQSRRPKDHEVAKKWFITLSSRVSEFSRSELSRLSETPFVPVPTQSGTDIRWLAPNQCYLGTRSKEKFHSKLFEFVDFGVAGNVFLTACGAKQEPSIEELAKVLLENPDYFYKLAQGPNNFLDEIRNIAFNRKKLSGATIARMRRTPVLLCSKRKIVDHSTQKVSENQLDDEEWQIVYELKSAEYIVIADDTNAHQVFGTELFTAPQEDIIEAFYMDLGSRRLSSLVKEEHLLGPKINNSKRAVMTRALILERLPIFLHEHNHARMKVTLDWLQAEANFQVKVYGHIRVQKTLTYGKLYSERKQEASAVAQRGRSQCIELKLADNAEIDMYEVAICLNRFIFDSPKTHDALLFMTILSTDLKALKRRGYNVDRILRQRKLERQKEEARVRDESSRPPSPVPKSAEDKARLTSPSTPTVDLNEETGRSSFLSTIQNIRRKVSDIASVPVLGGQALENAPSRRPGQPTPTHQIDQSDQWEPQLPGGLPGRSSPQHHSWGKGSTVTPLSNIASNIAMAMKACREESNNLLRNRQEMHHVREIDNEGYCDISGHTQNMKSIGTMGQVKIFVGQDVPETEAQNLITVKSDTIARFIHIMTSLANAYELNLAKLHIFYDAEGGLIAFNRNGSIFLNLRYYESWHDLEVRKGRMTNALISWYFTLAHEIAHNLVQPHNSEHEFYFSAICEKYFISFCRVLQDKEINRG